MALCSIRSGLAVAVRLLKYWIHQGQVVPETSLLTFIEAVAHKDDMQPAMAAVQLGLIDPSQLTAAASSGHQQHTRKQPAAAHDSQNVDLLVSCTHQIAELCFQLVLPAEGDIPQLDDAWIQQLSCSAAAVTLFSCWLWQPALLSDTASSVAPRQLGAELLLALYRQIRHGPGAVKPSLDSLVLDLGLAAAGRAAAWKEGECVRTIIDKPAAR